MAARIEAQCLVFQSKHKYCKQRGHPEMVGDVK